MVVVEAVPGAIVVSMKWPKKFNDIQIETTGTALLKIVARLRRVDHLFVYDQTGGLFLWSLSRAGLYRFLDHFFLDTTRSRFSNSTPLRPAKMAFGFS